MNRQTYIKRTLYRLRQRYGLALTYKRITDTSTDYETGVQTPTVVSYDVKKAIRLPRKLTRSVNLGNVLGNFRYGGTYDKQVRRFIIEASQLAIEPHIDTDYILINSKRWNVVEVNEIDDNLGYVILTEEFEGAET